MKIVPRKLSAHDNWRRRLNTFEPLEPRAAITRHDLVFGILCEESGKDSGESNNALGIKESGCA